MQKNSSLMVRLDEESKVLLTAAAELRCISVSDYFRSIVIGQATRELAAAQAHSIAMTPDEQLSFWNALKNAEAKPFTKAARCNHARRGVSGVRFPVDWKIELLSKAHHRHGFDSGQDDVNGWLKSPALQSQKKHLSTSKVLLDETNNLVGYYTLATSQVDFSDLPIEVAKSLPKRQLPVGVLAWLGVDQSFQGRGIGKRLLATALSVFVVNDKGM